VIKETPALRKRLIVIGIALVVAYVGGTQILEAIMHHGWVDVGSRDALDRSGVIYVPSERVFVVADTEHPVALSAISPHLGEQLLFCRSSGWFQDVHGDKFDRFGVYATGPSPHGMDHVELRQIDDLLQINPTAATDGLSRNARVPQQPTGPFCPDRPAVESGFARSP
jgi:Rieske Fe-S protein